MLANAYVYFLDKIFSWGVRGLNFQKLARRERKESLTVDHKIQPRPEAMRTVVEHIVLLRARADVTDGEVQRLIEG